MAEVLLKREYCEEEYLPCKSAGFSETVKNVEISVVTAGKGIHVIGDEADECISGDMYILSGGVSHGYFSGSDGEKPEVCSISFNPSELFDDETGSTGNERYCFGVFRNTGVSYALLNSEAMRDFLDSFDAMSEEKKNMKSEWESAVKANLTLLLVKMSRYINVADTVQKDNPEQWQMIAAVKKAVDERCGDNELTLESIAAGLYISPSGLSRIFRRVTGRSFAEYVRDIRIERACKLLISTNMTNEEIVAGCGLKDIPTFYKIFKSHMAMTPYQYRMQQQIYNTGEKNMSMYLEISENLQKGKAKIVKELVAKAIEEGLPAVQILNEGLLSGMNVIGEKFKNGEVYVPEVLVAARAMNQGMQLLKPLLVEDGVESKGKVCIGTVQGDLHDIGKNLVKLMMEGKGLEVIDLGTDVSPEAFVNAAVENNCNIICCSALLTTTMDVMADVVKAAENAGIRDKVKIMIGGAPVTDSFREKIGADCYTSDAASAADAAVAFCR